MEDQENKMVVYYPEVDGAVDIKGLVDKKHNEYDLPVKGNILVEVSYAHDLKRIYPFLMLLSPSEFNPKSGQPYIEEIKIPTAKDVEVKEDKREVPKVSWTELQRKARELGVYGSKMKRPEMEAAIASKEEEIGG